MTGLNQNAFGERWLAAFAGQVPPAKLQQYALGPGNYLWHVFSWKLLPEGAYLTGDEARAAYDRACKDGAVCLEPFENEPSRPLPPELATSAALDNLTEIYVTGAGMNWTYIKTHEDDWCGPYFCARSAEPK